MAYIYRGLDGKFQGPYPNKAGESCGNGARRFLEIAPDGTILADAYESESRYREVKARSHLLPDGKEVPSNKRIGRPTDCQAGTSAEMSAKGYVGIYLIKDSPGSLIGTDAREVDTDVLHEEVVSGQRPPQKPFNLADYK